nr:cell envelope integrity protein TolA [Kistimonas asteriae]
MAKVYVPTPEPVAPKPKPVKKPKQKPVKKPEKKTPVKKPEKKVPVKPVKSDVDRKKALAEQQRREREAEKQREAEAARKAEEAQRLQEQEMLAALERDQAEQQRIAEQLKTDANVVNGYVALIEQLVRQNWSRPPSARQGMTVKLRVRLTPTGEIVSIETLKGSGNPAFDDSAIRAVQKAAPFRELGQLESRLFESHFRAFNFYFDPQDLLE